MFVRLGEGHLMKNSFSIFCVAVLSAVLPAKASVNVTQHHNHDSRDVSAVVPGFDSSVQSQRAALAIASGILYVPYGGRFGDCGNYRGRLVGIQISNPSGVMAWATTAIGGGVWGVGGVAVDDINPFVVTGNTLFVSNPARFLPVHPAITGHLRTG
jgi:hypothetical protein